MKCGDQEGPRNQELKKIVWGSSEPSISGKEGATQNLLEGINLP